MIDPESMQSIAELEQITGKKTGIGKILRGECETGITNPIACTFCVWGHMLDCHWPYICMDAECSHYLRELENEY